MINLENLTKVFPGQDQPAVEDLSMEIYEGEIVVFVGPSGCGKTTTMKMINRLIEPTSGRIFLDGEDVTGADPVALRRRIGYVIQQIGLFPHQTIADNVGTVPRLLAWDRPRAAERTDGGGHRPRREGRPGAGPRPRAPPHRLREPADRPFPPPANRRQRRHRPPPARLGPPPRRRADRRAAHARRSRAGPLPRPLPG